MNHAHSGGDTACQLLYCDQVTAIEELSLECDRCGNKCGPCMGCADDEPGACDECRGANGR